MACSPAYKPRGLRNQGHIVLTVTDPAALYRTREKHGENRMLCALRCERLHYLMLFPELRPGSATKI
jgi:hypothetical protein